MEQWKRSQGTLTVLSSHVSIRRHLNISHRDQRLPFEHQVNDHALCMLQARAHHIRSVLNNQSKFSRKRRLRSDGPIEIV